MIIEAVTLVKDVYDQVQTMQKVKKLMGHLELQLHNIKNILEYDGFNQQIATGKYPHLEQALRFLQDILENECSKKIAALKRGDFLSNVKKFFKASDNRDAYKELVSKINGAINGVLLALNTDNFIKNEGFREWMKSAQGDLLTRLDAINEKFEDISNHNSVMNKYSDSNAVADAERAQAMVGVSSDGREKLAELINKTCEKDHGLEVEYGSAKALKTDGLALVVPAAGTDPATLTFFKEMSLLHSQNSQPHPSDSRKQEEKKEKVDSHHSDSKKQRKKKENIERHLEDVHTSSQLSPSSIQQPPAQLAPVSIDPHSSFHALPSVVDASRNINGIICEKIGERDFRVSIDYEVLDVSAATKRAIQNLIKGDDGEGADNYIQGSSVKNGKENIIELRFKTERAANRLVTQLKNEVAKEQQELISPTQERRESLTPKHSNGSRI